MAPKKYGDHMSHDVKGGTNINFQPQILIQCSSDEEEGFIDVRYSIAALRPRRTHRTARVRCSVEAGATDVVAAGRIYESRFVRGREREAVG